MNITYVLLKASNKIARVIPLNENTAKFEAQLLLQHILKVNRAWLIAHENDSLQANTHKLFEALLNRRLQGEPIAYILGYREFYGLTVKVTADTLIPRPDTETLVDAALAKISHSHTSSHPSFSQKRESILKLKEKMDSRFCENDELRYVENDHQRLSILDLGTGSGAIALAIAKHRPKTQLIAVDASQAALNVAIENAQNLNITNIGFILSDWFSALNNQLFDVIVSNPPYIEANDIHLSQGDLRFEPLSALASGADGFEDIRRIISNSPQYLNKNGWLMFEHGYNQAKYVAELLAKNGFSQISHVKDLAGIVRVTIGQFSGFSF